MYLPRAGDAKSVRRVAEARRRLRTRLADNQHTLRAVERHADPRDLAWMREMLERSSSHKRRLLVGLDTADPI